MQTVRGPSALVLLAVFVGVAIPCLAAGHRLAGTQSQSRAAGEDLLQDVRLRALERRVWALEQAEQGPKQATQQPQPRGEADGGIARRGAE